jgi:hypothetical protein
LKLTKKIQEEMSSPNTNMLYVEDSLVFLSPNHRPHLFVALRVRHKSTGIRYVQLLQVPAKVGVDLGEALLAHSAMGESDEPGF